MKKHLVWLLSFCVVLTPALAACGANPSNAQAVRQASTTTTTAARTPSPRVSVNVSKLPFVASSTTFAPKRPGAAVSVQRRDPSGWRTVVRGKQNRNGTFYFRLHPANSVGKSFRTVSRVASGRKVVSRVVVPSVRWRAVWNDEFRGTRLDAAKWRTRVQPASGRRQCATPGPNRVSVRNGLATLSIRKVGGKTARCPHGIWKNAMIGTGEVTKPGFTGRYGLYAARVKFQSGRGQHGAFWLQAAEAGGAEIDVAEYFGDGRADGGISSFVHRTALSGKVTSVGGSRPIVKRLLPRGQTPSNSWHVWSVQWSPNGYVFRMDGKVIFATKAARVATREFMVLSLLTSDWELGALNTAKSTMKVDWVRVWQH